MLDEILAADGKSRSQRLKAKRVYKGYTLRDQDTDNPQPMHRSKVKMCMERARILTKSYKETEGLPEVLRRAKGIAKVLDEMTIYIDDDQLIAGNFASNSESMSIYPEIQTGWLTKAISAGMYEGMLDEASTDEFWEIASYWKNKSLDNRVQAAAPSSLKGYGISSAAHTVLSMSARPTTTPDYPLVLKEGLKGRIKEAGDKIVELEAAVDEANVDEYIKKKDFLEAAIISCEAAIRFAHRFADMARGLAEKETDAARKSELIGIANNCDWVPENPPRTFYEALQSWYFIHLISRLIETRGIAEGSRFDQVMYPFYKADMDAGNITREQAQELLEVLWIKLDDLGVLEAPSVSLGAPGINMFQTMDIGGVTAEGDDATNEMSFLMLDASMVTQTVQPTLSLRYHPKIDPQLLFKSMDLLKTGIGFPAIFNDNVVIPYLLERYRDIPISLKDARNWANMGCVSWQIPGKAMHSVYGSAGHINMPKCLELALNQGIDMLTGKQIGYSTPDPATFASYDDVMDAFVRQVGYFAEKIALATNIANVFYVQYLQRPFTSAVVSGCIQEAKDCIEEHYMSYPHILNPGPITVVDSMSAIKKFVFDEKIVTMPELVEILKNNFEGHEDLRLKLINEAPKFGNDDPYVDLIAREVHQRSRDEVMKLKDIYGVSYELDGSTSGGHFPFGLLLAATPDGRKAREPYSDGTVSPTRGMDKKGPTAVLRSVSRAIPSPTYPLLLNQKFLPQFLEGKNKQLFAGYLKSWAELGIWHVQFNVADTNTLRDAQAYPENYPDLVVRVAGYSAYFVDLGNPVQNDIISRTNQCL